MDTHFGYNCTYYIPAFRKCRILIAKYRVRGDLVEDRWFDTRDIMTYLALSGEELLRQIAAKELKVHEQKDGRLKFAVSVAYQYDDCPMADTGGQCFYFKGHGGQTISGLIELPGIEGEHPNWKLGPSEDEVGQIEGEIRRIIDDGGHLELENQAS